MIDILVWLIIIELIGLIIFPISFHLFPMLKDRGFAVSKTLGILSISYLAWLLSVSRLVPNTQVTLWAIVLILFSVSCCVAWNSRKQLLTFIRFEYTTLISIEFIFLTVFIFWIVYRAVDPSINNTEQPMDFAFLNASIRTFFGSPEDPWLRGESISYYYFGYWMMSVLSKLSGIQSSITYNLSLALIPSLAASSIFSLVFNIVRNDIDIRRYAYFSGLVATAFLIFGSNLEGVLEFMRANGIGTGTFWQWIGIDNMINSVPELTKTWHPEEHMWWWRATRVIGSFEEGVLVDYTIHEFPFFSFILGDLHPHVMSIPLIILLTTLLWSYLISKSLLVSNTKLNGVKVWYKFPPHLNQLPLILVTALCLGTLGFVNMWDFPVFISFVIAVAFVKWHLSDNNLETFFMHFVKFGLPVIIGSFTLILPYLFSFTSQVSGIGLVEEHTTRVVHFMLVWGIQIVAVSPMIFTVFWRTTVDYRWRKFMFISLLVGFLPLVVWITAILFNVGNGSVIGRFSWIFLFAMTITITIYSALSLCKKDCRKQGQIFALILTGLGLMLIMGPELFYVDDGFEGAWSRMNTVFKLHYQAWVILCIGVGYAVYQYLCTKNLRILSWYRVWFICFCCLFLISLYYPISAIATRIEGFRQPLTLDGLAYLKDSNRLDEYRAIEFIKQDSGINSALVEALGADYTDFGKISSSTGVPTVLGWVGHEVQWRGASDNLIERQNDVVDIYSTTNVEKAKSLLAKYSVTYVYYGLRERKAYGVSGMEKFSEFMDIVFDEGDTMIFKTRRINLDTK